MTVWYLYFFLYVGSNGPVIVPGEYTTQKQCEEVAARNIQRHIAYPGEWREHENQHYFCVESVK